MVQKEQCFIITPIGDENSEIRRHIEGIIDAVIKPALEEWYEIEVAHRISTPGSITKQIIEAIYNSKLVIANLTNCNPNVMYELALRHGIGKPVIMIAVEGTKLPSDIMMQRTIFYRNDALGVLELRDKLKNTAEKIDFEKKCGMVFEALGEISHDAAMLKKVAEKDSDSREPLEYIMRRLDRIEALIPDRPEPAPMSSVQSYSKSRVTITYEEAPDEFPKESELIERFSVFGILFGFRTSGIRISSEHKAIYVYYNANTPFDIYHDELRKHLCTVMERLGFKGVNVSF